MMPLLTSAAPAGTQVAAGVGSVVASVTSGLALGGAVIGILAGLATVVSLFLLIAATNRRNRRDYEQEIRAAEERGEDRQREWTEYWKAIAMGQVRLPSPPPHMGPSPDDGESQ